MNVGNLRQLIHKLPDTMPVAYMPLAGEHALPVDATVEELYFAHKGGPGQLPPNPLPAGGLTKPVLVLRVAATVATGATNGNTPPLAQP